MPRPARIQSVTGTRSRGERLKAGKLVKANRKAKQRWMTLACPSFTTPTLNRYGSGDAYQSWNSAQQSAMTKIRRLTGPDGLRAPVSASATRVSSVSREAVGAVLSLILRPLQRQATPCRRRPLPVADLHPALFLVVLDGARMQRRREA